MIRVLVGVGNTLSGDDGVGPAVAAGMENTDWKVIAAGSAPENVTGQIRALRPDLLVIVDAAHIGLPPGSIRRLPLEATDRMLASTHGLPLSFLIAQLEGAAGQIVIIGVEPHDLSLGAGLSPPVAAAVDSLIAILRQGKLDEIPIY